MPQLPIEELPDRSTHHATRLTRRACAALVCWIVASAAVLSLVALFNGYPLVYPDTGTYLRQAIEFRGAIDRPPYYSLFLFPLHLKQTLWAIPLVQNLLTCYVVVRFLGLLFDGMTPARAFPVVVALTLFSSLPWVSNEIMPDIFTALIVLVCFALVWFWHRLARLERLALVAAMAGMIALHQANTLLVVALLVANGVVGLLRHLPRQWFARLAAVAMVPLCLGIAAQALYGYAMIGQVTPSPMGPVFLLARMLYDGPARQYLDTRCPIEGTVLCAYRDRLIGNSDWFLWDDASPIHALNAAKGETGAIAEASTIVRGTLRDYPLQTAAAALRNGAEQFVRFDVTDINCPCSGRVMDMVTRHFPRELPAYRASLQNAGGLPWSVIAPLDSVVVVVSAMLLAVACVVRNPLLRFPHRAFLGYLLFALVANAWIMGALSGPADRYQARLVWLIPLAAFGHVVSVACRSWAMTRSHEPTWSNT